MEIICIMSNLCIPATDIWVLNVLLLNSLSGGYRRRHLKFYICTLLWRNELLLKKSTRNKDRFVYYIWQTPCISYLMYVISQPFVELICCWNYYWKVKEWLHSLGIVDQTAVVQDVDEPDDGAVPFHNEDSLKKR